jgi:hypothetical protein
MDLIINQRGENMKKLEDVIIKELFINAFHICQDYSNNKYTLDTNINLLRRYFLLLSDYNVEKYYTTIIHNDLVYSVPFLYETSVVNIPKNINGLREYRYFTSFSMVLFNAVGLLFADVCNEFIKLLKFEKESIYRFSPTVFSVSDTKGIKATNQYQTIYKDYQDKLERNLSENVAVLSIDISNYFESINHGILINALHRYGSESKLAQYNLGNESDQTLSFYFESLMQSKKGIPQGKTNSVSDLFGLLYLLPLDLHIKELVNGSTLQFKSFFRYVDDMTILFTYPLGLSNRDIHRELSTIEQKITRFLYEELSLALNSKKTQQIILHNTNDVAKYMQKNIKKVSGEKLTSIPVQKEVDIKIEKFCQVLSKYTYSANSEHVMEISKDNKETLKVIYEDSIQKYIFKPEVTAQIQSILAKMDIEIAVDEMNILIILFFLHTVDGTYLFYKTLLDFIENRIDFSDKRVIHIIVLMLSQFIQPVNNEIGRIIESKKHILFLDNYGRYALLLSKKYKRQLSMNIFSEQSIFNEIAFQSTKKGTCVKNFIEPYDDKHISFIRDILSKNVSDLALNEQIKMYIWSYKKRDWNSAFNYLLNSFDATAVLSRMLCTFVKALN